MTDERDPRIRAAVVELATKAPDAPAWDEIEEAATERRHGRLPEGSRRRVPAWAAALAAAVTVLVIGGVGWLLDGTGDDTLPPSGSSPTAEWEEVAYSVADGLPGEMAGVAVDRTGGSWAARQDGGALRLYRLVGDTWEQVGEPIAARYHMWMVPDGAGGVVIAVDTPQPGEEPAATRVVRFDGSLWIDYAATGVLPLLGISTVVTDAGGTDWIVGYRADDERVVVARVDGGVAEVAESPTAPEGRGSFSTVWRTVAAAPDGAIWIGTSEGAWRFSNGEFEVFAGARGQCCAQLAVDTGGTVWRLDATLDRLVDGAWVPVPAQFGEDHLAGPLVTTPDGALWVLQDRGVYRFDETGGRSFSRAEAEAMGIPLPDGSSFGLATRDGTVFVLAGDRLHRYSDGDWEQVPTTGFDLSRNSADWVRRGMAAGPDGSLWATWQDGVVRFIPPE